MCSEISLIYLIITLLGYIQYSRYSKASCISLRRHLTAEINETLGELMVNHHQSTETLLAVWKKKKGINTQLILMAN